MYDVPDERVVRTWDSLDPLTGPVRRHTRSIPGSSLPRLQSARRTKAPLQVHLCR